VIKIHVQKKLSTVSGDMHLSADLSIEEGELVALYGASGAGKTSVLRMIAGLLPAEGGVIKIGDEVWYDHQKRVSMRVQKRRIGIVFQDYALFPNMTARENISYGMETPDQKEVDEMITLMELNNLEDRKPSMLSAGQRQRVALARAVMRRPKILLLDEPFAALDTSMRMRMHDFLLQVHRRFNLTTILVSHDAFEVARLADRVFLLENGLIAKMGKPKDVIPYQHLENLLHSISTKFRE
jgi:molybdate transport system ATP-binding protein